MNLSTPGTLAADDLHALIASGAIRSNADITDGQVQPSSLDLTISSEVFRMPGSILPLPGESVRQLVEGLALEKLSCTNPLCLVRDAVYVIRLRESCALPEVIQLYTNSKSSSGRIDLATRVICDGNPRYDRIPAGYHGDLWIELVPRSFDCVVRSGDSVNQAIAFTQRQILDDAALRQRHQDSPLLYQEAGVSVSAETSIMDGRVVMRAHLNAPLVGWMARSSHKPVVLHRLASHHPQDFFTPLERPRSGFMFLEKDRFYILSTDERVVVPIDLACEMVPYDPAAGEFRAHYAGFFDPGWGATCNGTRAVLEVRPHADDLVLRHGQPICAMAYERLTSPCSRPYGSAGNNYADQNGPRLSKHFISSEPDSA
ncbi:MAG: 2'-deoxycytidine 5'-triphosphate deaminase [Planctomycetota bacterium]|nr:MAG: 2'-deoxycytidine 5'-triphosphate deaminase [Planctomycetota bacterium]